MVLNKRREGKNKKFWNVKANTSNTDKLKKSMFEHYLQTHGNLKTLRNI